MQGAKGAIELVVVLQVNRLNGSQNREQVSLESGLLILVVQNADELVEIVGRFRAGVSERGNQRLVR